MEREIEACTMVRVPLAHARRVLVERPDRLGVADEACGNKWGIDLDVELSAEVSVRQRVWLELGPPRSDDDEVVVPVFLEASAPARLFPQFAGELEASGHGDTTRLCLRGAYRVPLGFVGRFGDGIAGRRLARASVVGVVERIAAQLEEGVAPLAAIPVQPILQTIAVTESAHSELYIG